MVTAIIRRHPLGTVNIQSKRNGNLPFGGHLALDPKLDRWTQQLTVTSVGPSASSSAKNRNTYRRGGKGRNDDGKVEKHIDMKCTSDEFISNCTFSVIKLDLDVHTWKLDDKTTNIWPFSSVRRQTIGFTHSCGRPKGDWGGGLTNEQQLNERELRTVICKALARMSQFNHCGLRLGERLAAKMAPVCGLVCVLHTF
ncbi:hypothetical protein F2P81_020509 [Scophthalmus maximus]|uniref:Uncharacterized protein n=1 Tax=Scophthalmus maximus TaxID=52904 RepID=A0A6A4S6F1_SCOMX|nr:hypothetical protein F2P81_020509 [Scophthalmus maximus]